MNGMTKRGLLALAVPLALGLSLGACSETDAADDPVSDTATQGDSPLVATIGSIDQLSIAGDLIEEAGLEETFEGVGA